MAHVITGLELGGGGQVVVTIARALDRSRFEMDVYCIHEGGDMAADLRALGCRVVLLEGAWDYRRRFLPYSPRQILRLASLLREARYDVVHTHIFQADLMGRVAARLAGVPVVVKSLHNMGAWKRRGHLITDRFLRRWTDAVICCSDYQREVATVQEHLRAGDAVVINNGVDPRRFQVARDADLARELRLDLDRPIVGTVGRMIDAKGHQHLIQAIPSVLVKRPDTQFLFVGDGPLREGLWAQLPSWAQSQVRFAGARPEIPQLLALMTVFAFPSISEGFPIAPLEAMASGLPVVASDIRPLRDIVVSGETGYVVPVRDSDALARAILMLVMDPALHRTFSDKARERVHAHFSAAQMVRATERVYERLLDQRQKARGHQGLRAQPSTRPQETGELKS